MKRIVLSVGSLYLAAFAAMAQDPVKLSPQEFKVEFENDRVRVLRTKRGAHQKVGMHEHPPYVVVSLTDLHIRVTGTDGNVQEVSRTAGGAAFSNAVRHFEENLSDQPLEAILIELKGSPAAATSFPLPLDPVTVDPKHHTVILENERVRVLRSVREPHAKIPMHEHPASVVVSLTDLNFVTALADGTTAVNRRTAGEAGWRDARKHAPENQSDQQAVEILTELK